MKKVQSSMLFLLLTILSSFTLKASAESAQYLCDNSNKGSMITSPLERADKSKWCLMGTCEMGKETINRELCIKQIAENSFSLNQRDFYKNDNASGVRGSVLRRFALYAGDACFEECRPESKKKFGVEKKSCVQCLLKQPKTEPDSFEVVGHGVTLQKGQKCYYACKLPEGHYSETRSYSTVCLQCIKPGFRKENHYLIDSYGKCYEFIEGEFNKVYGVPMKLCQEASSLHGTVFKKGSSYDIKVMLFGKKPACIEVDDFSFGGYLSRETLDSRCDDSAVNEDERSKMKEQGGKPLIKRGSPAKVQQY